MIAKIVLIYIFVGLAILCYCLATCKQKDFDDMQGSLDEMHKEIHNPLLNTKPIDIVILFITFALFIVVWPWVVFVKHDKKEEK